MNYTTRELEELVDLAKAGAEGDPIDWGDLSVDRDDAYRMMAAHVLDMDPDLTVQRSVIVKLLVENFVLNLKLMGKK